MRVRACEGEKLEHALGEVPVQHVSVKTELLDLDLVVV